MSAVSRGTLPQNFIAEASTGLRLVTPQPQYFFAKMALASNMTLAALNAGLPTAQQFVSIAGGGSIVNPGLGEMVRAGDAYPGAVRAFHQFGKDAGDTIKMRRPVYTGAGYSEAARLLGEESVISTTGQAVKAEEVPVILKEYGGPANAAGTAVEPYKILNFDAKYRKNKDQLASVVTDHLGQDYTKWLDAVIRDRFIVNGGNTNVTLPSGIANAAAFVAGGGAGISLEQMLNARKALSDREWAKFPNGRYMLIVPTSFNTQMVGDVDYREMSKTHAEGKNLLYGYVTSVQDIDIFECTTLATYAATGATSTNINGSNVAANASLDEALLIGPDAVGFGTAVSEQQGSMGPEVRWSDDTNYGRHAAVIWYALHAFQTLDVRGVQRVPYQTA